MKNFIIYLAILACSFVSKLNAQNTFESKAKAIAKNIDAIVIDEKAKLKTLIEEVNLEIEKSTISKQQAEEKKLKLAETSSKNIEARISVEEQKLSELVQEKVDRKIGLDSSKTDKRKFLKIYYGDDSKKKDSIRNNTSERRTTSQVVFAAGINNLVTNGEVSNSDFRYLGSHFYEIGFTNNTRLSETNNLLHFKYGLSLMFNNLRATNSRVFVENGNQTTLQNLGLNLSDSRFRTISIVAPLHLELDFTPTKTNAEGKTVFKSHEKLRLGLGGFLGANYSNKQFTEYSLDNHDYEIINSGNFNTTDFVYGTSAYIGFGETSLYAKYDLNNLFKNNTINQHNISLGIRWDFN
jgi:hypothetical protein